MNFYLYPFFGSNPQSLPHSLIFHSSFSKCFHRIFSTRHYLAQNNFMKNGNVAFTKSKAISSLLANNTRVHFFFTISKSTIISNDSSFSTSCRFGSTAPFFFSLKEFIRLRWEGFMSPGKEGYRFITVGIFALFIWYYSFILLTDRTSESSAFLRQSLFNCKMNPKVLKAIGEPTKILPGSVTGGMNMLKGWADVEFLIEGPDGTAKVKAQGRRVGLAWQTIFLSATPLSSEEGENSPSLNKNGNGNENFLNTIVIYQEDE